MSNPPTRITVAVDAMGGDLAPQAIVAGAVAAAQAQPEIEVLLVGDEAVVTPCLNALGPVPANISLQHAAEVIGMCDAPGIAIRQKRNSSIVIGMRLVRDGRAHAMFSAGNSGAMMAGAMLILKAQPGIDRPAIASFFPSRNGNVILLDAGATTDCKPANLVQFAHLGSRYAAAILNRPQPRIGLLSIGEEQTKGDDLTKETHQLLLAEPLNFHGNVEPKDVLRGDVDVVVCDGFVGNLMLKAGEGFCEWLLETIKAEITRTFWGRVAGAMLRPAFRRLKKRVDYAEYGGALLLGVNGVVIISHGRSNERAAANAIRVAAQAAERHVGEVAQVECCESMSAAHR
ncbi:MAG TPA: phosphate acyltransferase PlsX [Armatimonadota bacterium]